MQEIIILKTCPFCGSNNLMKIDKKGYGVSTALRSYIECKKCGIRTRIFSEHSRETVEEFWNRRDGEPMKEFPCKIGDTVYWAWNLDKEDRGVFKGKIRGLSIGQNNVAWFSVAYENGLTFEHTFRDYWEKTVFINEEQAIAKYKELLNE